MFWFELFAQKSKYSLAGALGCRCWRQSMERKPSDRSSCSHRQTPTDNTDTADISCTSAKVLTNGGVIRCVPVCLSTCRLLRALSISISIQYQPSSYCAPTAAKKKCLSLCGIPVHMYLSELVCVCAFHVLLWTNHWLLIAIGIYAHYARVMVGSTA